MSNVDSVIKALKESKAAILEIQRQIKPLQDEIDGNNETTARTIVAKAAVALSIGTLRYMGARLQGLDQGRQKNDPLRQELDHMRKLLAKAIKNEKVEAKKREESQSVVKEEDSSEKVAISKTIDEKKDAEKDAAKSSDDNNLPQASSPSNNKRNNSADPQTNDSKRKKKKKRR